VRSRSARRICSKRPQPSSGQGLLGQLVCRCALSGGYGARGKEDAFGFGPDSLAYDTNPRKPIGDWKEAWEKAKERAGAILRGESDEPQPIKVEPTPKIKKNRTNPTNGGAKSTKSGSLKCRFHDLRHSAVTRLLEAGVPYPLVANIMGWSAATAIRMSKRYGHIGQKVLRDAMDVLGTRETRVGSLKNPPKSRETENQSVQ
jgi:Phage integrase family